MQTHNSRLFVIFHNRVYGEVKEHIATDVAAHTQQVEHEIPPGEPDNGRSSKNVYRKNEGERRDIKQDAR